MTKFQKGQKVVDGDGYTGTIVKVTEWRGSVWYDVRFVDANGYSPGEAVRYDSDLRINETA